MEESSCIKMVNESLLFQTGFVNALKFSQDGRYLIAGIGQEHRLGRWWRLKEAKNSICVIPLNLKTETS